MNFTPIMTINTRHPRNAAVVPSCNLSFALSLDLSLDGKEQISVPEKNIDRVICIFLTAIFICIDIQGQKVVNTGF